jgi:glycosyltransferase involved in cell wall biosynthesis
MTMRLALATTSDDPRNPRAWSGIPNAIHSALEKLDDIQTDILGPLKPGLRLIEAVRKAYWKLRFKRYLWEREPRILRLYELQFEAKLKACKPDIVLTIGSIPAAALPRSMPYVVFSDATFRLNVDYYLTMTGICDRSLRLGEEADQRAFRGAKHVVVTSDWAAASVMSDYGVAAERVSIVPMGAQHVCQLAPAALQKRTQCRLSGPMRLLWAGVEWERKGGDIAVAIVGELCRRGIAAELNIAGLRPPDEISMLPFVRVHGFLDARTQKSELEDLFLSSFALLLPSRAENTSVVIADAASFGLPSFVSDTGGMRTMVHDGANGQVFPTDAPPSAYADALLRYQTDPIAYLHLGQLSRRRFETDLSWDIAIRKITSVLASAAACPARDVPTCLK